MYVCVCVCVRVHSIPEKVAISCLCCCLEHKRGSAFRFAASQPDSQPGQVPSSGSHNRQAVSAASRPFPFRPESCLVSIRLVVFPPQLSSVDHFLLLLTSFASSASANLSLHFGLSFLSGCVDIWLLDKIVSNRPRPEVLASRFLAHPHHPSRQQFAPKKRWLVIVLRP